MRNLFHVPNVGFPKVLIFLISVFLRKILNFNNFSQKRPNFPDQNGHYPANIYLFKFNNRIIRKRCKVCSKLPIKTPEQCH